MNTAKDIVGLARAARKAGISTMLQLQIAGELLSRGESTLISLSNAFSVSLEAIAHSCAGMVTAGGIKVVTCRDALGFSIAKLTPQASHVLAEFLNAPEPLRAKKISR